MNARQIIESETLSVGNGLQRITPDRPITGREMIDHDTKAAKMDAQMRDYFAQHPGTENDFMDFWDRLEDEAYQRDPSQLFVNKYAAFEAWYQAQSRNAQKVIESFDDMDVEDLACQFVEDTVGRYHFAENWPKLRDERTLQTWLVQQGAEPELAQPIMAGLDQLASDGVKWVRPETFYLPGKTIGKRKEPKEPKKK